MTPGQVCLQIGESSVFCEKQMLIANSDYFRAMFEGNFVESSQKIIKLIDVDLKAMQCIISILLSNESLPIESEEILMVLQTACMLQFERIKERCVVEITEMLSPINCLQVWRVTEKFQIRPLSHSAKVMALEEFLIIKDLSDILDLTLEEIYCYLGHIYLKTDTEFSVFQTIMNWWSRNRERYVKHLPKLLSCIDWPRVLENHLYEMMSHPHISDSTQILYVLWGIVNINKDNRFLEHYPTQCQTVARSFLTARRRGSPTVPCILANCVKSKDQTEIPEEKERTVIYYDKFKRKRFYQILDNSKKANLTAIFYDYKLRRFKKYFDFDDKKCIRIEGFGLSGYRRYAFLYGGEYKIGKGSWNLNLWAYDVIKKKWDTKDLLPIKIRHFKTCIVGDILYIIGGNGGYRVIQDTMIWYNLTQEIWGPLISLPTSGLQLKCCNFSNQLLLLDLRGGLGYIFDTETFFWHRVDVFMDDDILSGLSSYCIFSYNNLLYIKGNRLIVCTLTDLQIRVINLSDKISESCDKLDIALCDNIVYTLYTNTYDDIDFYTLEIYDLDTGHIDYVFRDKAGYEEVEVEGDQYTISSCVKIFPFEQYEYYNVAKDDALINANAETDFSP